MSAVDEQGNVTGGLTLYDVIRWLIRGGIPNTEFNQRQALLAVDAAEQGMSNSKEWEEELQRRAETAAPVEAAGAETSDQELVRLRAENARLQALQHAQTASAPVRPAPPEPPPAE